MLLYRRIYCLPPLRNISRSIPCRTMATARANLPHEDRTVDEPRHNEIHPVVLSEIEQVNDDIKLFKLSILNKEKGVKFHPGQWLDVLIPTLPKAGGFTLTSTPTQALPSPTNPNPYLELAIQRSSNPPAKWLWQAPSQILHSQLFVRVGGSFVWPPVDVDVGEGGIERVVFVAGGVGINPLISMLSHISTTTPTTPLPKIKFLYSVKNAEKILFLPRLQQIISKHPSHISLDLFITGASEASEPHEPTKPNESTDPNPPTATTTQIPTHKSRITKTHLLHALNNTPDKHALSRTACFVCGPPKMTDEIVAFLGQQGARVYCERWW